MLTRRTFLQSTGAVGAAAIMFRPERIGAVAQASASVAGRSPEDVAKDEAYWGQIQQAFELDRTIINLNTGHHCSSPKVVRDSVDRFLDMENLAPVYYAGQIGSRIEPVRRELAAVFGCDPEELAITRNASESLQILQNGIDLVAGDEVITTEQDYPRMLTTWDQRMRRDKIKVTRLQFPVPTTADDLDVAVPECDHAEDEGLPLLPHHESHRPALPGAATLAARARARHHDHRRRRACRRAVPVHVHGPRLRHVLRQPAQMAARPARYGDSDREEAADSEVLAAPGRAGDQRREHPQVRGDRDGAQWR